MATFGRARRTSGGAAAFGRPLVVLLAVSLGLLLLRDTAVVRGAAAGATDLLVPVERVLGAIGAPVSHAWQAVTEIETLRSDDAALRAENDRLTLENVQLQEQAFSARQCSLPGRVDICRQVSRRLYLRPVQRTRRLHSRQALPTLSPK